MTIKNIFLDRDGTIIQDMHYLCDPEKIILIPGALEAMRQMKGLGLDIFLVTNQSGIGRNYFSEKEYHRVQDRLELMLQENGITITDSLFCPHKPEDKCHCRKPAPGMWDEISEKHGLLPEESLIIGDKESDIVFGCNCRFKATVLTLTGHGRQNLKYFGIEIVPGAWFETGMKPACPTAVAENIFAAWDWIRQRFIDAP